MQTHEDKFETMEDAMRDEAFISDLRATMVDFEHADYEEEFTECASPDE